MAIDFPNSPSVNDLYTAGGKTWQWNGTYWAAYGTGPVLRTSDTAPVSPNTGDLWYETDTGRFFTYIDSAWVEIGSTATTNVNANDLSGTTLASNVVSSSLTSVGTITNLQATAATINGWTVSQPGLVFIKSQSISSGASSVNVTSAFSSSYDAYKIVITGGALSATANISLKLGSTTSGYYSSRILNYPNNGTPAGNGENNTSAWGYAAQGGTNHVNCNIELLNPYLSKYTTYSGSYFIDSGAGSEIGTTQGFLANTTSYTDFTLTPAGQTFSSGTVRVYGYRNS